MRNINKAVDNLVKKYFQFSDIEITREIDSPVLRKDIQYLRQLKRKLKILGRAIEKTAKSEPLKIESTGN